MSVTTEVSVIIYNIRNIDLHHRGLYRVRARLAYNLSALYTLAYGSWPTQDQDGFFVDNEWTSRPVNFQYVDQKFDLYSAGQFRSEYIENSLVEGSVLIVELLHKSADAADWEIVGTHSVFIAQPEYSALESVTFAGEYNLSVELGLFVLQNLKTRPVDSALLKQTAALVGREIVSAESGLEAWLGVLDALSSKDRGLVVRDYLRDNHFKLMNRKFRSCVVREVVSRGGELERAVKREVANDLFKEQDEGVIVFEKTFVDDDGAPEAAVSTERTSGRHVVFLVHGLYGDGFSDFRVVREELLLIFPNLQLVISESNEYCSDEDISIQGRHFASEVARYMKKKDVRKVSFIGFSLGGLVIRAALEYLDDFKSKLGFYMSLSTPHTGILESRLVEMGVWLMRGGRALRQLTLADGTEHANCYLHMINDKLEWFQNVVLIGGIQDKYVHTKSSLIEDAAHGQRILGEVPNTRLVKLDVHFDDKKKRTLVDGLTGRHYHMMFLENRVLWQLLGYTYRHWFD